MSKILMLVRTSGLDYDDRIRKEASTLVNLGYKVSILANYTNNKSENGVSSYGVPYKVYSLFTRNIFPSAKFLPLKMFEFWIRVYFDTLFKKYDYVWVHEEYMVLNILIKPTRSKYIFDLHELPQHLAKSIKSIGYYHKIESKLSKVIVANADRLSYMIEHGLVINSSKYYVLNNYPDKVFLDLPVQRLPVDVNEFIRDSKYILMQGGGHVTRYPLQVLSAIKRYGKYKAIIVGPIAVEFEEIIKKEFASIVYCAGYVKQLELTQYIDHAWASIILYGHSGVNNIYCEPNRFYQALNRGIPVIVGNNPPMKRIINETGAGIVLDSDGGQVDDIVDAVTKLEQDYDNFKLKAESVKEKYIWETQTTIIQNILK